MKYTISQLSKKYNQQPRKIRRWIKWGWLPAEKQTCEVTFIRRGQIQTQRYNTWLIEEEDFLDIPTFVRERRRKT